MTYHLTTSVHDDQETVVQELRNSIGDVSEDLARWVLDMREASARFALIKLGWTPPPDKPDAVPRIPRRCSTCASAAKSPSACWPNEQCNLNNGYRFWRPIPRTEKDSSCATQDSLRE